MTGTVEFIQRVRYVEIQDEKGEMQIYAIPETVENVQELVRCKDCKHYKDGRCFFTMRRHGLHDDWFCADGERRDDDA